MPMRPLRLPGDLVPLAEMLVKTFQYPENPEWGIRADEEEDLAREIRNLRRIWPIVRAFQFVSPALRDLLRGFVWEEDGRIVGVVLCQHQGTTRSWGIGIVGVLPEHRGRGIARALLMRALDDLRSWDADKAILSVIDRNVPAYGLYKSVGFEHYSGAVELECGPSGRVDVPALPTGYVAEPVRPSRLWRLRYELDQRITPPEVRRYQPVVIGRYRPPVAVRAILPAVRLLQRREERVIAVRQSEDGRLVADRDELGHVDVRRPQSAVRDPARRPGARDDRLLPEARRPGGPRDAISLAGLPALGRPAPADARRCGVRAGGVGAVERPRAAALHRPLDSIPAARASGGSVAGRGSGAATGRACRRKRSGRAAVCRGAASAFGIGGRGIAPTL